MRVVLSQIFYPVSIGRYFEAALRRRQDIELFTVGPYTGTWIPWRGGIHLPQKYAGQPDFPMAYNGQKTIPIGFVETQLPWTPDLWLQIDAGFYLEGKPAHGKNIIVGTDPHVLNYDRQRAMADDFYCMQACYASAGDKYLPYAYDPTWHAPEDQPKMFDVILLGLHYENRNRLINALRQQGVECYYDLGPSFDEARELYNQAPIGLNWSSRNDLTARVFELLGMRRLAVVNRVPDLAKFFEDGKDLIAFDSLPEAVTKVLYYLDHKDELDAIAKQGHETVKPHNWDMRIEQILGDI